MHKQVVLDTLTDARKSKGLPAMELADGVALTSLGLDSLDLAMVVAQLDDTLGIDPFAAGEARFDTVGQFVALYGQP